MSTEPHRGELKIAPWRALGEVHRMETLMTMIFMHKRKFRPNVLRDRIIVLCNTDQMVKDASEKCLSWNIANCMFTKENCKNEENIAKGWAQVEKKEVQVSFMNMELYEEIGLPVPKVFMFLEAAPTPERFRKLMNLFVGRQFRSSYDVHVDVFVTKHDEFDFLQSLSSAIETTGVESPRWLLNLMIMVSQRRSRCVSLTRSDSSSSLEPEKKPKTVYDLVPDANGQYFCPAHLLSMPKKNGEYDSDEEFETFEDGYESEHDNNYWDR